MAYIDNILIRDGLRELRRRLPPGWEIGELRGRKGAGVDGYARVVASDRRTVSLAVEAKARLDPRTTLELVAGLRKARGSEPVLVVSRYLSPSVRDRLRESDFGFLDLTGNIRLVLGDPGLYIEVAGADQDPNRKERPARSLRGAKAGRVVRALIDLRTPPGVRDLAVRTGADPGYVSRVITLLESEALVTRVGRGRIDRVDWVRLLRRWAQDAPCESRGRVLSFIEPRGLTSFVERLAKISERYAVTGSLAAVKIAPIAPSRLATVYVTDARTAAEQLALRPADAGANVLLIEVADEGVFERAQEKDGVMYAAPSQAAADLLTSPGRGPAEAEALITWMTAHEEAWRG
jgi:hypothetical protein